MAAQRISEQRWAIAMLLLANFYWGLSFPVIKAVSLLHLRLLPQAGTWFSAIYCIAPRFVLSVIFMALWYRGRLWRPTRGEIRQGCLIGLFAAGGMLLQNDGLQFTSASTSAFLTQLYAVMIPIWVAVHGRRVPGVRILVSCVMVLAGVAILGHFDPLNPFRAGHGLSFGRGEWETLLCSVFFMGQILMLERKRYASNRPEQITFLIFATQAVLFGLLSLVTTPSTKALVAPWTSVPWLGLMLVLTIFCTIGAFSLMNAWQPKITATEAGLIYCIEPIFGSAIALFLPAGLSVWCAIDYPNERLSWSLVVGGGLITAANLVLQLKRSGQPAASR
jgi:drug/metabolite transporter (DMT)-like permease